MSDASALPSPSPRASGDRVRRLVVRCILRLQPLQLIGRDVTAVALAAGAVLPGRLLGLADITQVARTARVETAAAGGSAGGGARPAQLDAGLRLDVERGNRRQQRLGIRMVGRAEHRLAGAD